MILTTREEVDLWLPAQPAETLALQRPLPAEGLWIVARSERADSP